MPMKKGKFDLAALAVEKVLQSSGASRISPRATRAFTAVLEKTASTIAVEATKLAEHTGRKTVTAEDVRLAKKNLQA